MLGLPPGACLSIGDRLAIDVIPAEQAGLRGALVTGPADLRRLGERLLAAAGAREHGACEAVPSPLGPSAPGGRGVPGRD